MDAQKPFEVIDWHGNHLHITQDGDGNVKISHYPFETHFNVEEMREIGQFMRKYG